MNVDDKNEMSFSLSPIENGKEINKTKDNSIENNNEEIKIDRKCELTIDFMMIVGKYYKKNIDFINTVKVNSIYRELPSMYHFNPISDTSLFENMETQHFYKSEDLMRVVPKMYQYVNWTDSYITNETKIRSNDYPSFFEDYDYNDTEGELVFKENVINKRPVFTNNLAKKFIVGDTLYVPKEFDRFDRISGFLNPLFESVKIIYFEDNIRFGEQKTLNNLSDSFDFKNDDYLIKYFDNLETIRFPRRYFETYENFVCNCPKLKRVYIPREFYCLDIVFNNTRLEEIILSRYFTEEDLYNFFFSLEFIIVDKTVFGKGFFNPFKTVKIFVRNIELDKQRFTAEVNRHDYMSNLEFNKDVALLEINEISVIFIFTDIIEKDQIDY